MRPILASASSIQSPHTTNPSSSSTSNTKDTILPTSHMTLNMSQVLPSDESTAKSFNIASDIVPTISVLVHLTTKPDSPENIHEYFLTENPFQTFWIQTIYEQYDTVFLPDQYQKHLYLQEL